MPLAAHADRQLFYQRRGSGAPLLLIQGMAGHHQIWGEPLLERLATDFDVVAFDHRGIGDSTDVPGQFSITDLAADAAALMDHLGWDSAHVFGISLGGMVAQELALQHPERVRSLVLGCTYAGGPGSSLEAPGPLRMLEAMNSGDLDRTIRAAYTANLSADYIADESHFEPFKTASLAVRNRRHSHVMSSREGRRGTQGSGLCAGPVIRGCGTIWPPGRRDPRPQE